MAGSSRLNLSSIGQADIQRKQEKINIALETYHSFYSNDHTRITSDTFLAEMRPQAESKKDRALGKTRTLAGLEIIHPSSEFRFDEGRYLDVIDPTGGILRTTDDPAGVVLDRALGDATSAALGGPTSAPQIAGAGTSTTSTAVMRTGDSRSMVSAGASAAPTPSAPRMFKTNQSFSDLVESMHSAGVAYVSQIQDKTWRDYFSFSDEDTSLVSGLGLSSVSNTITSHRVLLVSLPVSQLKIILKSPEPKNEKVAQIEQLILVLENWRSDLRLMTPGLTATKKTKDSAGMSSDYIKAMIALKTKRLLSTYITVLTDIKKELSSVEAVDVSAHVTMLSNNMGRVYKQGLTYLYQLLYFRKAPRDFATLLNKLSSKITVLSCSDSDLMDKFLKEPALEPLFSTILSDARMALFNSGDKVASTFVRASAAETLAQEANKLRTFHKVFTASDLTQAVNDLAGLPRPVSPTRRIAANTLLRSVGSYTLPQGVDLDTCDVLTSPLRFCHTDEPGKTEATERDLYKFTVLNLIVFIRKFLLLNYATIPQATIAKTTNVMSQFVSGHLNQENYDELAFVIKKIEEFLAVLEVKVHEMDEYAMATIARPDATLDAAKVLMFAANAAEVLSQRFSIGFSDILGNLSRIKDAVSSQKMSQVLGIISEAGDLHRELLQCATLKALPPANTRFFKLAAVEEARTAVLMGRVTRRLEILTRFRRSLGLPSEASTDYHRQLLADMDATDRPLVRPGEVDLGLIMLGQQMFSATFQAAGVFEPLVADMLARQFATLQEEVTAGRLTIADDALVPVDAVPALTQRLLLPLTSFNNEDSGSDFDDNSGRSSPPPPPPPAPDRSRRSSALFLASRVGAESSPDPRRGGRRSSPPPMPSGWVRPTGGGAYGTDDGDVGMGPDGRYK